MRRTSVAPAAILLLVLAVPASAADRDPISTHCRETEISLDATHTVARLGPCGDVNAPDLLWHLDRIDQIDGNLDGFYHREHVGTGSVVYVMDTGVLASHAEFMRADGKTRVIAGYDATDSILVGRSSCHSANKALQPCYANFGELAGSQHGTSVASLVAGQNVGVAPEATIVSIRVMNESALSTTRSYLDGLNAIIRNAYDPATPAFRTAVVNISGWVLEKLNGNPDDAPVPYAAVEKKIREMINGVDANGNPDPNGKRFLFVVAGNNVDNGCGRTGVIDRFPATMGQATDGLITVGGMTSDNSWWPGACHGGLEILAPSQSIFSASITANDHYRGTKPNLRSGTSFAAPIISGIAARMLSDNPNLTPQQLEAAIVATPSRIFDPDRTRADGKVACFLDVTQPVMASSSSVTSSTASAPRLAP